MQINYPVATRKTDFISVTFWSEMRWTSEASADVMNDEYCNENICSNHGIVSMNVGESIAYVWGIGN